MNRPLQCPPLSTLFRKLAPLLLIGFTVGKFGESVLPVTYALPDASTAILLPTSWPFPPRKVEYTRALPVGFNFVTKASGISLELFGLREPGVVGKIPDVALPVMYALPEASTAIAKASALGPK